jgi:hypothetical protein
LATLILAWVVLEAGSCLLLSLASGELFSWSKMQDRRDQWLSQIESRKFTRNAQVHPYVGFVEEPQPNYAIMPFSGGAPVFVSDYGYFDDKPPIQRRGSDRVVIGITGGSVACYFAINGTKRLADHLKKLPRFAGKKLVFVNLALPSYKEPQQLMSVAYLLSLGAEFDLILNIDGFNEVAIDSMVGDADDTFPAFPVGWRTRIAINDMNLGLTGAKLLMIDVARAELAARFSSSPWRYSIACNLVWELLDRPLDRKSFQLRDEYGRLRQPSKPSSHVGPPSDFADRVERDEFLADIWLRSSVLLDRLCRSQSMAYFHFLQPNQYLAGSKPIMEQEKQVAFLEGHPYGRGVVRVYPVLIRRGEILRNEGVNFHDLTGIFAGHPEPIYIDNCCHYNQIGYEIMADAIANAIQNGPPQPIRR